MQFSIVNQWNIYLNKIPVDKKDIYYTEEYTKLYESNEDTALCVIGEDGEDIILMPFLRRRIREYYDFETAYGYGGPITNSNSAEWINMALSEMQVFFRNNGYICGFIRFHPLLENALFCKDCFRVINDRKTIAVDMKQSVAEIWKTQITSKNRNMIRKAEKNGLSYRAEYNFASILNFLELYNKTMERLCADEFYYFPEKYYKDFSNKLDGKSFLGVVLFEEKIVGAALFMYTEKFGHYHLAGSDRTNGSLGINNYLLWKTIEELSTKNIQEFHLGGGLTSLSDDSLFKFKKSFGNSEREFYIGKWIFDNKIYEDVCNEWEIQYPNLRDKYRNMLLKYRYRK